MMMKMTTAACLAVLCALWALPAAATSASEAVAKIKTYEFGQSREHLTVVEDMVRAALDDPGQRRAVAGLLADVLASDATLDAKRFVCRQLVLVGGPQELGKLVPLLYHPETADMALYVLEPMQSDAVDAALLNALKDAPRSTRVAIVNALGERRAGGAISPLLRYARDENTVLAEAAIAALGKIGTPRAANRLGLVKRRVQPELRASVAEAQIVAAERLVQDGRTRHAQHVYRALLTPQEPDSVRVAAFFGLARLEGGAATMARVNEILESPREDAALRQAVRHYLNEVASHYQLLADSL